MLCFRTQLLKRDLWKLILEVADELSSCRGLHLMTAKVGLGVKRQCDLWPRRAEGGNCVNYLHPFV